MPHNIEKSAFRKGEYVGYGGGCEWRIRKNGYGDGYDCLTFRTRHDMADDWITGRTLKELSRKLETYAPRKTAD